MKLIVDIDTLNSEKNKISSTYDNIKTINKSFENMVIKVGDNTIDNKIEQKKQEIVNKVQELIKENDNYIQGLSNCINAYNENENKSETINTDIIVDIVRSSPDVTRKYQSSTIANVVTHLSTDLPKACQYAIRNYNGTEMCSPLGSADYNVTDWFGYRPPEATNGIGSTYHRGIDLAAYTGQPLVAAIEGKVIQAEYTSGYGNCIVIEAADGTQVLYGHLSNIDVSVGQEVYYGDEIGQAGSTGPSTGTHLHFEVIKNNEKVDPAPYLGL